MIEKGCVAGEVMALFALKRFPCKVRIESSFSSFLLAYLFGIAEAKIHP